MLFFVLHKGEFLSDQKIYSDRTNEREKRVSRTMGMSNGKFGTIVNSQRLYDLRV
jgi:hypothetical protein